MYFPRRSAPLELSADRLLGLRLSLNTPVVSMEELPVGPARAAVVVHEELDGRPNITVGVHSLRNGAVVLFSFEGDLREYSSLEAGVDAALSFGEGMGFLFDEDEFESAASVEEMRPRALGLWTELMGGEACASLESPQHAEAPSTPSAANFAGDFEDADLEEDDELLLEELADPASDVADASVTAPEGRDSGKRGVSLSKFRHRGAPEPQSARTEAKPPARVKGAALARLKLVKRRKSGGASPPKLSAILRLLSSL
jgi:hypothetical protein